jgi:hypothetical protein
MFDLKSLEEEMYMKRLMLKSQSAELLRRSLRIILKWKAPVPHGILHIHGTRDGLISAKNVRADHWIEGGGHFMVWNRAKEISEIINRVIGELQQKSRS